MERTQTNAAYEEWLEAVYRFRPQHLVSVRVSVLDGKLLGAVAEKKQNAEIIGIFEASLENTTRFPEA